MCLAVPGRIVAIDSDPDNLFTMAEVDFCGVRRRICVDTVDNARPGDYVVAHAGVAITLMDADTARAALDDLESITSHREQTYDNHD